ncbi:MAG: amidase [Alphaproteobacteria bacterium]|nr:amidase [Alphaproteobacteria bacterium]
MTELVDTSAVELRRLIGTRQISPVELLQACLRRIDKVNPRLNAVTAMCVERAQDEAKAAEAKVMRGDPLPPLHGLPVGIKDLSETGGLRTTWGSPLFADHVPAKDERMVAGVRAAGAIVVGKTNVPEWGAGANTNNPVYGPTGNAWDPARICGGSSGGSGVALATSMLPICTGSDTGGSLRIPAAFSGVVGYRPSPGLVPSERRALGWTALSVVGPMGRSVADACLLMQAMASDDSRDPFATAIDPAAFAMPGRCDLSSLRVAFSEDLGFAPVDNAIRATFRERVGLFQNVFKRAEWRSPDMEGADFAFETMRAQNFLASHKERYEKHRDKLGPNIVANYEQGLKFTALDIAEGHKVQTRIFRGFQDFFREFDFLITPTVPVAPFPVDQLYVTHINGEKLRHYFHWLALTYGITLTGHPSLNLPCGLEPTGTPFGLQVIGRHRGDIPMLAFAHALEQVLARDPRTARPIPDLARLAK